MKFLFDRKEREGRKVRQEDKVLDLSSLRPLRPWRSLRSRKNLALLRTSGSAEHE
jgi:hypothetical protein